MSIKKVYEGWIGADESIREVFYWEHERLRASAPIHKFKGRKPSVDLSYWPPRKIRVTVEEI